MRKRLMLAALLAVAVSLSVIPADSQRLNTFQMKTVLSTEPTVITWVTPSTGIYIQNTSDNQVFFLFGNGTVNTTNGAGGGVLDPYQNGWFPIRCYRLALRCSAGSANVRIWVYKS